MLECFHYLRIKPHTLRKTLSPSCPCYWKYDLFQIENGKPHLAFRNFLKFVLILSFSLVQLPSLLRVKSIFLVGIISLKFSLLGYLVLSVLRWAPGNMIMSFIQIFLLLTVEMSFSYILLQHRWKQCL